MTKPVLLCLHGWGGSKESFTELRTALAGSDVEILTPDLPGFGAEPEPPKPWTTDDYADWVTQWLEKKNQELGIKNQELLLLGHSHGGRIAITLASRQPTRLPPITRLYLCAAAGVKHRKGARELLGLWAAKAGGAFLSLPGLKALAPLARKTLYRLLRSHDYERASPLMRETLKRVTEEDVRPLLHHIAAPTNIFWGTLDRMTPVKDAHILHHAIRGSHLHLFPGSRHRIHRDHAHEIAAVIRKHLHVSPAS
ncbi:MAG: alpha/beta fold hydrolase [Candidatus Peribacteraceae bacterium]|nr:alpha/beta fold hydrolase [Candidatus Peribacteraceae bacterium]